MAVPANPVFHRMYAETMRPIVSYAPDIETADHVSRISIFMTNVTSVEQIIKMCSEAIDDLIGANADIENSISILSNGIAQLDNKTKDSEEYGTGIKIPGSKTPMATYIAGGVIPLLVKCIANLHILKTKHYTHEGRSFDINMDLFLTNLLGLFVAIANTPDGYGLLKDAGLFKALTALPPEIRSNIYILKQLEKK